MEAQYADSCNWTGEVHKKVRTASLARTPAGLQVTRGHPTPCSCNSRISLAHLAGLHPVLTPSPPPTRPACLHLQAFNTQSSTSWSKRTMEFSGAEFKLTWKKNGVVKDSFVLNPLDVDFGPSEEHHRPFEIKVVSLRAGTRMALYFCPETADDQNVLITRMDAARRLKVASVSTSGTVFSDERTTLQMALTSGTSGPEAGAKAFSWGLGALLGVAFKSKMDGMSIPHKVAALTPRCVFFFFFWRLALPCTTPLLRKLCALVPCPGLRPLFFFLP